MIRLVTSRQWKEYFPKIAEQLFAELQEGETLVLNLVSETSFYVRLNSGKVRQITDIEDTAMHLDLVIGRNRRTTAEIPLTFVTEDDVTDSIKLLRRLRKEAGLLPTDQSVVEPPRNFTSESIVDERDFREDDWLHDLLAIVGEKPVYGLIAAGRDIRAMMSSTGSNHWHQLSNYFFDYSLRSNSGLAIKGLISDHKWDKAAVQQQMEAQTKLFHLLEEPVRIVPKGTHKVYLGPQAMVAIMELLSSQFGEGTFRRGANPLKPLQQKQKTLNPLINIYENAVPGLAPRFNELGELSVGNFPLIENGELKNTLISPRTAKEYNLMSNGAMGLGMGLGALWGTENLRAAELKPGTLPQSDVLAKIGNGLYIGNLHYLNWSDMNEGRFTGMTRFDCFLVEDGKLVGPFAPMRFDDSIYSLLGNSLEALTAESSLFVNTNTYERRTPGGWKVPGAITEMTFTL